MTEDADNAIVGCAGIIILIILIIVGIQHLVETNAYETVKNKVTGVDVVDYKQKREKHSRNNITSSDDDVIVSIIKNKYEGYKVKGVTIRSISNVYLRSNNDFSAIGELSNGRKVTIIGPVKKKNGKITIKHKKIYID